MKLGRNLTNTFTIEVLTPYQQKKILSKNESLFTLNAWGIMKMKDDILHIIKVANKIGISHLEIDCDVPSPYIEYNKDKRKKMKKSFKDAGISLSVHLPYTMSAVSNIASLQEVERKIAENTAKKYLDFAFDIEAISVVIHPGRAPFYFSSNSFLKNMEEQIIKSLTNLALYISQNSDIKFHLENNTAFDGIYYNIEDCVRVVKKVRKNGGKIYFNFDIGHWFTKENIGEPIPENFLDYILNAIPQNFVYEFHLNDYITHTKTFHPPLIEQQGKLKKDILKRYAEIIKKLGVKLLVLETAFHNVEHIKNRYEIIKEENDYISDIFGVKW